MAAAKDFRPAVERPFVAPTLEADMRAGRRAQAQVGLIAPILEIVPAFLSRPGEIRDLVLAQAEGLEPALQLLITIDRGILIHRAALQHFFEGQALDVLQEVDRDMVGPEVAEDPERLPQ